MTSLPGALVERLARRQCSKSAGVCKRTRSPDAAQHAVLLHLSTSPKGEVKRTPALRSGMKNAQRVRETKALCLARGASYPARTGRAAFTTLPLIGELS